MLRPWTRVEAYSSSVNVSTRGSKGVRSGSVLGSNALGSEARMIPVGDSVGLPNSSDSVSAILGVG